MVSWLTGSFESNLEKTLFRHVLHDKECLCGVPVLYAKMGTPSRIGYLDLGNLFPPFPCLVSNRTSLDSSGIKGYSCPVNLRVPASCVYKAKATTWSRGTFSSIILLGGFPFWMGLQEVLPVSTIHRLTDGQVLGIFLQIIPLILVRPAQRRAEWKSKKAIIRVISSQKKNLIKVSFQD